MPSYLVETFLPRSAGARRVAFERRARSAAEELTREGTAVGFERVIHVPEDEVCFFVFVASFALDVERAVERAGLDALRVVEAVSSGEEPS